MPTVRVEFELDSEVYPELHAALSALRSTRARAERVRQLAAAGLVWEKVRLHGSAAGIEPVHMPAPPRVRELPVLVDVVADVRTFQPPDDDDAHDDDTGLPDATLHVTALSHKPATRSRLMRMKERGLFKNG